MTSKNHGNSTISALVAHSFQAFRLSKHALTMVGLSNHV